MPANHHSDTTTHDVRIVVKPRFMHDESSPEQGRYLFGYRVMIENRGDSAVQLVSRHWIIVDGDGESEEVRGPGVIGEMPVIAPGKSFQYTSYCPLNTEWGTMEGAYQMRRDDGEMIDVAIGRFYLVAQPVSAEI